MSALKTSQTCACNITLSSYHYLDWNYCPVVDILAILSRNSVVTSPTAVSCHRNSIRFRTKHANVNRSWHHSLLVWARTRLLGGISPDCERNIPGNSFWASLEARLTTLLIQLEGKEVWRVSKTPESHTFADLRMIIDCYRDYFTSPLCVHGVGATVLTCSLRDIWCILMPWFLHIL